MEPVPPVAYGGTERVVAALAEELTRRGHDVTLYAAGDSRTKAHLVPTIPKALWTTGYRGDVSSYMLASVARCWRDSAKFDIVHSHAEVFGLPFARYAPVPVVSTMHGRLDQAGAFELLEEFRDVPLVAISESQKRWSPEANWVGVVHNGLLLDEMPFSPVAQDYLLFVGRVAIEKGIDTAIDLAKRTGSRLKIAAKMIDAPELELYEQLVEPALEDGRIEYLGEIGPADRDPLYARARATLMLSAWPEPFGLVAIESLAAGTPVIARRSGALPEFIVHGEDGFLVDDVAEAELALRLIDRLDRTAIRERSLERFGAPRMAAQYERIYRRLVAQHKEHVVGEGGVLTAQPEERVMRALHSQPHGEDREEYRADAPLERRGQRLEAPAAQQGNVAREP
jgi:glycosyltransferase involved in cell wall biosynthesis